MKIGFYVPAYPGKHDTSHYAFVKQLVDAIAEKGNTCYVVAPYNVFHYKKIVHSTEKYQCGYGEVVVYRPYYLSLSKVKCFRWFADTTRKRALKQAEKQLPPRLDAVYCHFWGSGYDGYQFAKTKGLPLFVATGESDIKSMFTIPADIHEFREYVSGVVCVSSKNREESINLGLTVAEKCGVFPNAVNKDLFHRRDKNACRKQLGVPMDQFIVAFVGWFNDRKGSMRVAEAINRVGGIGSFFIGKGVQDPQCEGILFKGAVPHEKVSLYLGAADCFVLPTLHEGCCNAVVEAMACGLPVISSNLSFNWDVLDESNSIMVNPNSVEEIASAIQILKDDVNKRNILSEGAAKKAESLTIERRAAAIIDFINEKKIKK